MESQYFIYDGKTSTEMGLYNVRINHSGFVETPLWGQTNIQEDTSRKRLTSYFYGVTREPIKFTVQFMLADENMQPKIWTPEERNRIAKWLVPNVYKKFQTYDDLSKQYYAMITNEVNLNLIGTKGYVELTFVTNSPFAWTEVYDDTFDLSDNITTRIIELENKSNVLAQYRPKLVEIELVNGETSVQLKNLTNGNKIMKFEGLTANETISIDCENEIMKSNLFGNNPFSKFNRGIKRYWLDLISGVNQIEVTGMCIIKIRSQFPIAQ